MEGQILYDIVRIMHRRFLHQDKGVKRIALRIERRGLLSNGSTSGTSTCIGFISTKLGILKCSRRLKFTRSLNRTVHPADMSGNLTVLRRRIHSNTNAVYRGNTQG